MCLGFGLTIQVAIINCSPLWLQTVYHTVCLTRRALRALLGNKIACVTATCRKSVIFTKGKNKKSKILLCLAFFGYP